MCLANAGPEPNPFGPSSIGPVMPPCPVGSHGHAGFLITCEAGAAVNGGCGWRVSPPECFECCKAGGGGLWEIALHHAGVHGGEGRVGLP